MRPPERRSTRSAVAASAAIVVLSILPSTALGDDAIDPDADRILRQMSDYLGGLKSYSFDFDTDTEIVLRNGQKLQITRSGSVLLERPGHLYATRMGAEEDAEIFFDGKMVTFYGKALKIYAQLESKGTIDQAIDTAREEAGLDAPGADLLYGNVYENLMREVDSGDYWGATIVNKTKSHHLSFRSADVDWQIWVQDGDKPLPLKFVITSKWMKGDPQYTAQMQNWNVSPAIAAKQFEFTPPAGAKKIDAIAANDIGEIAGEEGGQ